MRTFCNTPSDCQWLRETHLKGHTQEPAVQKFKSFILYGHEDCPSRIDLFESPSPNMFVLFIRFDYNGTTYTMNRIPQSLRES